LSYRARRAIYVVLIMVNSMVKKVKIILRFIILSQFPRCVNYQHQILLKI